ncbi:hypothetical protein GQ53DRAFT_748090 [Thozetella sp. PMI_491]|nr:hypothetical protein GQ53DRAFT_748090 [Thozetella sp. PMI_491]
MRIPLRQPQAASSGSVFGIRAGVLIPGRGEPLQDGAVVVSDTAIAWAGPYGDLPPEYATVVFTEVPVIMPGMWDVHTHFMGTNVLGAGIAESLRVFLPGMGTTIGAITVDDFRATLEAGFTSVRELGGYGGDTALAVELGRIPGPHVYSSFVLLSMTAGHGDSHDVPVETVLDASQRGFPFVLCDGVDSCTKSVRQAVRRGAKVIKICSTGGVLSLNDQPEDSQFSPAELRAIVDEAERNSRVVASHAIGKKGILAALEAGVKTIEHGMYLDEEVATKMKEKGAILVPTRHIVEALAAGAENLPPASQEKLERMTQLSRDSLKLAIKEGVKIALGTDSFSSSREHPLSHGRNARELVWAVQAGMTPLQAIEMATATPPETVGRQARKSGLLKAGYDADIIAIASNPLVDIEVLTKPSNVTHVWKTGKMYKSP